MMLLLVEPITSWGNPDLKKRIRRQNPARLSNGRQCLGFDFGLLVFHDISIKKERVGLTREILK
jgi:hypothetical protein